MSKNGKNKHPLAVVLSALLLLAAVTVAALWAAEKFVPWLYLQRLSAAEKPDWVDVQLIPVDGGSRRGQRLEGVSDIVIHYVANPGTTARQNRGWYENPESEVSSHFIVGLEGEIIQCVPLDEMSSATNWRNKDTISIEVCHPDETGKFNEKTYDAVVKLTAWLLENSGLNEDHVIRHYDVTGKECPRYFVQHEDAWEQFKTDAARQKP